MAVVLSLVTFFSTGLGGVAALRFRDHLHLLLGFSAGAVLGVVFFDVLPEITAVRQAGAPVMLGTAAGYLAYFLLERYTALHQSRAH
jgi:zinc transporter, ZIP family